MSCRFIISLESLLVLIGWLNSEKIAFRIETFDALNFAEVHIYNLNPDIYKKVYDWISYRNRKDL